MAFTEAFPVLLTSYAEAFARLRQARTANHASVMVMRRKTIGLFPIYRLSRRI
jgi:hypothetical protein